MSLYIVCNWKTYIPSHVEAVDVVRDIDIDTNEKLTLIVCPSSVHISDVVPELKKKGLYIGMQDISISDSAHTGRISAQQMKEFGVTYVIVGHAETRAQGITNISVADKVLYALQNNIQPIICISDEMQLREILEYLKEKMKSEGGMGSVVGGGAVGSEGGDSVVGRSVGDLSIFKKVLVAYEPLEYIGATEPFSSKEMSVVAKSLRGIFSEYGINDIPVLYGGSVMAGNVKEILKVGEVDGVLVGRASVTAISINAIIQNSFI